ncbi:MAG TPA: hypothetical protein VD907_02065 [Verrucomicrobiae bacterium]|nr:hypothetical protein [Verrucomicrobiae bacterium]
MSKFWFVFLDLLWRIRRLPRNLFELWRLPKVKEGDIYIDCGNHVVYARHRRW